MSLFHCQLAVFGIDLDGTVAVEAACKERLREVVEQEVLDGTLDRTCAELGVVAFVCQEVDGFVCYLKRKAVLAEHLLDVFNLQADNLLHFAPVQGMEDDDFVDTVQELWTYAALNEQLANILLSFGKVGRGQQVARHNDDGVLEVDGSSFGVGQTSIIEHLQQRVEHIGMCFLYLVEEHDLIRLAANGFRELTALVVADISWRRTNEPGNAELLLILAHVDARHHGLIVEEILGKCLCKLCLAHTRRAEEDEAADGSLRVLKACTTAANGVADGSDGFFLTNDALVKFLFQMEQLLGLARLHLAYGNARPAAHNIGNIVGCDFVP